MRVVLDTNVVVAALLHPGRTPERAVEAVLSARVTLLADARIEAEYRDVLARPKFAGIPAVRRDTLLMRLLDAAERVDVRSLAPTLALIDPDDLVFVEVAVSGAADAVLTGNARHFPRDLGFDVLSPAELLARLIGD